jgi:YjjG family noncanonical pyrimidine nucleotidase
MIANIRLVLFDLDDTLIHFDDYWEASVKEAFQSHPITSEINTDELFRVFFAKDSIYAELYDQGKITLREYRTIRFCQTLAEFNKQADESVAISFENLYREVSKNYIEPSSELIGLLSDLQKEFSLGIVTNGTSDIQHDKIAGLEIKSFFPPESIIISEEVGFSKPHPQIYKIALERFNVKPEETVFVGDSWENDVEGPSKLGIQTVWFNNRGRHVPDNPAPMAIIKQINELSEILIKPKRVTRRPSLEPCNWR